MWTGQKCTRKNGNGFGADGGTIPWKTKSGNTDRLTEFYSLRMLSTLPKLYKLSRLDKLTEHLYLPSLNKGTILCSLLIDESDRPTKLCMFQTVVSLSKHVELHNYNSCACFQEFGTSRVGANRLEPAMYELFTEVATISHLSETTHNTESCQM